MVTNKEKNFISAVLYIHSDTEMVRTFLPQLFEFLDKTFNDFEIICVDDASGLNMTQMIQQVCQGINKANVSVVTLPAFSGVEVAMNAGVDLAIGDFVYEFDSWVPVKEIELILQAYKKALGGYDIVSVIPVKSVRVSSKLFYTIFNRYNISSNRIYPEIFCLVSRRAINRIRSLNQMVVYRKAVRAYCGLPMATIECSSNQSALLHLTREEKKKRRELAGDCLILFTNVVEKMSYYICLLFLLFTVLIIAYAWGSYFYVNKLISGWASLMLFLSISMFGIFLILTIVLKYLSVLMRLVFRKKRYLTESVEKITNS